MRAATLLEVFVPGKPIARPSARMWKRRKDLYEWSRTVAWTVRACMVGKPLVDEPVALWLTFYTQHAADLSNLVKTVEDAMTKVFYTDDRHVKEIHAWIENGAREGVAIVACRREEERRPGSLMAGERLGKLR